MPEQLELLEKLLVFSELEQEVLQQMLQWFILQIHSGGLEQHILRKLHRDK